MDGSVEDLDKVPVNRYEAVIIASKYARILNRKLRGTEEGEEEPEEPRSSITDGQITSMALKELKQGKLRYEKPRSDKDKGRR
jgi:DNA-directed RNA polymerase subunit K/omega